MAQTREDAPIYEKALASNDGQETVQQSLKNPKLESQQQERHASSELISQSSGNELNGVNGKPSSSHKQPARSLTHDIALITVLCFAQVLLQASLAQSIMPLDYISASFGVTDPGQQSWLTAAFSLTVGTFILPAGRLGDMYGHKTLFLCGLAWYALWSIICGVAVYSGLILFAFARAMQGIGPSLVVPNALALVGREIPEGFKRNLVFSLFGACAPGGFQLGAVFVSLLAQFAWWPWAFWIAAIFAILYAVAAYFIIPCSEDPRPAGEDLSFDWAGCILGVSGLVLFNFAWNQAGVVGWQTPYTYVLLIVGIILLGLLCLVELKYAKKPLLPVASLSRASSLALACIAAGWASFGVWVWYLVGILMNLREGTPLLVTAETCGLSVSGATAALLTAYLLPRLRPGIILMMAMLAFAVGQVLVVTAPLDQIYWAQIFPMIIIMPFGMDFSFPSGTIILSNAMAREDQGVAASLVTTVVNYSISLGLGVAGTISRELTGGSTDKATVFYGYKGAFYFAIGLDLLGFLIALYFAIKER